MTGNQQQEVSKSTAEAILLASNKDGGYPMHGTVYKHQQYMCSGSNALQNLLQ